MNWLNYAVRIVVVVTGTYVVFVIPLGLVATLLIAAVIILSVLPDPMWLIRKARSRGIGEAGGDLGQDD